MKKNEKRASEVLIALFTEDVVREYKLTTIAYLHPSADKFWQILGKVFADKHISKSTSVTVSNNTKNYKYNEALVEEKPVTRQLIKNHSSTEKVNEASCKECGKPGRSKRELQVKCSLSQMLENKECHQNM
ncbi:hypothetical protein RF11_04018 [Thelohanellus kitauei]|uniref:Uncharacterized protein n=1 Tax=Thelohanellus kitauei TaxID=669202 RepID=A0A0C2MYM8_THEKT|nr:hypothetical protein RF11_04018 [Thelohanellus kitauei]